LHRVNISIHTFSPSHYFIYFLSIPDPKFSEKNEWSLFLPPSLFPLFGEYRFRIAKISLYNSTSSSFLSSFNSYFSLFHSLSLCGFTLCVLLWFTFFISPIFFLYHLLCLFFLSPSLSLSGYFLFFPSHSFLSVCALLTTLTYHILYLSFFTFSLHLSSSSHTFSVFYFLLLFVHSILFTSLLSFSLYTIHFLSLSTPVFFLPLSFCTSTE